MVHHKMSSYWKANQKNETQKVFLWIATEWTFAEDIFSQIIETFIIIINNRCFKARNVVKMQSVNTFTTIDNLQHLIGTTEYVGNALRCQLSIIID